MTPDALLVFLLIVAAAGYFQTVTGFGLSMIVTGVTAGLGLTSVALVAAVVNVLALVNCAIALPGRSQQIDRRIAVPIIASVVPMIAVGVFLLTYLSARAAGLLQIALGLIIIYGGLSIVWQARARDHASGALSFAVAGACSGLCGGLFGMSGPPLIYQLYRQPIELARIRDLLILTFTITSLTRIFILAVSGQIDRPVVILSALAIPAIAIGTFLGRRCPPPLSPRAIRRVICGVLLGIGVDLVLSQLLG